MNFDPYVEARALGADLGQAGREDWETRIDNAIAGGATATEILMALRWTLAELVKTEPQLPPELIATAGELESGIARLLGR